MKNFLLKVRLYTFFRQLIFVYPVYSIMFSENGLSTSQIGVLLSVWSFTALIMEVPLGFLADKYSRKWILVIGSIFKSLVFLCWILVPSFWGYLFGFILWGISSALNSGTFEAYIYDELVQYRSEDKYESIMGSVSFITNFGVALAILFGGALSELGYLLVLSLSIISSFLSTLSIFLTKPAKITRSTGESTLLADIKGIIPTIISKKVILLTVLIYISLLGAYGALDEFYPLLFSEVGIEKRWIGVIGMGGYSFAALGGWISSKTKTDPSIRTLFIIALVSIVFLGTYFIQEKLVILLHLPLSALFVMTEISLVAKMQRSFSSKVRATSLSIVNMFKEVIVIFITLLIGVTSVNNSWSMFLVGGGFAVLSLLFLLGSRRAGSKDLVE